MATNVKKVCISLPPETLAQLDWLTQEVFKAYFPIALSKQIQMAISYAYYYARSTRDD